MALVGVEHLRLGAHRLQRPHPPDAEQDLLADAVLRTASVQTVGDGPHVRLVGLDVGIEHVQLDPAHLGQPHLRLQRGTGQIHRHPDAVDQLEGHGMGVEHRVALFLPAVGVEVLAEVPEPVHQPDPHQGDAQAAGRLEVVAGQHAQAAGVLREGLGDAELGREVGDTPQRAGPPGLEPPGSLQVAPQLGVHLVEETHEARIGGELVQTLPAHQAEEPHGVVEGRLPYLRVHPPEEVPGPVVPRPAQVEGQLLEGGQRLGKAGPDGEAAQGSHGAQATAGPRGGFPPVAGG